jgi:gliding motility-associated-like protein
MRYFLLITCAMLPSLLFGQVAVTKLFFSSFSDITKLNFDNIPPTVEYTGITDGFEAIAHVEDASGNIIFYVNANGVYRGDNVQMPGSAGLLANNSSAEINVCSIPGEADKYYILYNAETCSPLYYTIVDMSLAGGQGDVSALNVLIDNQSYGEGLEIVRIPNTENYWFVAHQCDVGIRVFEINNAGIQPGTLALPLSYGTNDVRGEMDYHNGKMAMADAYMGTLAIFDFDQLTGAASNLQTISQEGVYGVEFSPDATKLYYTNWSAWDNNLYQFDLNTSIITGYTLALTEADPLSLGQIEMGPDGRLYVISWSAIICVIENPNDLAITVSYTPTDYTLSLGVSDHIQSDVLFVEAMVLSTSSFPATCYGSANGVAAVAVETGEGPFEYLWDDPDAQTTAVAEGLMSGSYSVTVTDALGNTNSVIVDVTAPEELLISQETPSPALCFGENTGGAMIQAMGGTPPYIEGWFGENPQALFAGVYDYQITDANGCSVLDEVEILEPSPLQLEFEALPVNCLDSTSVITVEIAGGTPPYSLDWQGENPSQIPIGEHIVVVIDNHACAQEESYMIERPVYPVADFITTPKDPIILEPDVAFHDLSYALSPVGNPVYWRWKFLTTGEEFVNLQEFIYKFDSVGVYHVQLYVENVLSCADSVTGTIEVSDVYMLYIPSGFTPNGDQINDVFTISAHYLDESTFLMNVYDRWGGVVAKITDLHAGWDGTHIVSGRALPVGLYVYDVRINTHTGKELRRTGELHLGR